VKIILHGSLKQHFPEMEIVAATAADALEGWSRQCGLSDIPLEDRPVIEVLDFDSEDKLLAKTDVKELHLYPAMFGGGPVGRIIVGAALIVVGILYPPLGPYLISAGIGLVVGGVTQLFMKAPSASKSEDPDPSKYLGLGANTTKIGTLISKGYGRLLIGGHYLSIQVNSNDMVFGTFPTTVPA